MELRNVFRAWGRILTGYPSVLSIEITKHCPLSCPGCYAYQPEHLGGVPLTSLSDFRGDELVDGILGLVALHRPVGVYLVGGEPLVRVRELSRLLPLLAERKIKVEVVTSAVVPIPENWKDIPGLGIDVSIDGLPPEHDVRRKPATYKRILANIKGHRISVHCTVTSQMMRREGYLEEFVRFWSARSEVGKIRISFFTPQVGETSEEILTSEMRMRAVADLKRLAPVFPKLQVDAYVLDAYLNPPSEPGECTFARITECVSADLKTRIQPCQFGGRPKCEECGCLASAAMQAVGAHRLPGGLRVSTVFEASDRIGRRIRKLRERRLAASHPRSSGSLSSEEVSMGQIGASKDGNSFSKKAEAK